MFIGSDSKVRWGVIASFAAAMTLLIAACGSDPTATPTGPLTNTPTPSGDGAGATAAPDDGADDGEAEWQEILEAARAEGEVVVAMGGSASRNFQPRFDAFQAETGITVVAATGRGSQQCEKLATERANGVFSTDAWMTGITSTKCIQEEGALKDNFQDHFILPEVADPNAWYQGKYWFPVGLENTTMAFCASPNVQFAYNTDLVDASTLDSYWDLTEDPFKGQMVGTLPWEPGQTNGEFYISHPDLGEEFIRTMILDMEAEWVADGQQAVDLLANGIKSVFVYTGNASDDIDDLEEQGLPVKNHLGQGFAEGGVLGIGGSCSMSLLKDPPHPNAQKVLVNWWYGEENLYAAQGITNDHSLRDDIETDNMLPEYVRQPDVDYFFPEADPSVDPNNPGLAFQRQLADENGLR